MRLFKFAKVQEFGSSSVSVPALSCKEVALGLQLLTTQRSQTLMSWMMEKLQTLSLDLEKGLNTNNPNSISATISLSALVCPL